MFIGYNLVWFLLIWFIKVRLFLIVLSMSPLSYLPDLCIKVNYIFLFYNIFIAIFYIFSSHRCSSDLLNWLFAQCNFWWLWFLWTCLFLWRICTSNIAWLLFHITDFLNNWHWRFIFIIGLNLRNLSHHRKSQIIILITIIIFLLSIFISLCLLCIILLF